jgi:hypothetical protein
MKKVLFAVLAVTVLMASSCSKEKKVNKTMVAVETWKATMIDGETLPSGMSVEYEFNMTDKTTGTGTFTYVDPLFGTFYGTLAYTIEGEDKIILTREMTGVEPITDTSTIKSYSKTKLEFINTNNKLTVLEPK